MELVRMMIAGNRLLAFNIMEKISQLNSKDKKIIESKNAPEPVGLYPHARKVGNLLFLSGVGPREKKNKNIPGVTLNTNGEIVGKYRKMHPPANSSLEKIYYRNGANFRTFKIKDFNVSFLICADFYFPEAPRAAMLNGADLILIPFCEVGYYTSPNVSNKPEDIEKGLQKENFDSGQRRLLWNSLSMIRAYENACYVAPCNHIGYEFDSYMAGGSLICDPTGKIIAQAKDEETIKSE